jgi:hypothetical protein
MPAVVEAEAVEMRAGVAVVAAVVEAAVVSAPVVAVAVKAVRAPVRKLQQLPAVVAVVEARL